MSSMVVVDIAKPQLSHLCGQSVGAERMRIGEVSNLLGKCHHITPQSQSLSKKDPVHKVQNHIWDCFFWGNEKEAGRRQRCQFAPNSCWKFLQWLPLIILPSWSLLSIQIYKLKVWCPVCGGRLALCIICIIYVRVRMLVVSLASGLSKR